MKAKLLVLALLVCLAPGCTGIFAIIGSTTDSPKPKRAVAQQADDGPPGYRRVPPPSAKGDDEGMSGAATGMLLGAVVDIAVLAVLLHALSTVQADDCPGYSC